MYQNIFVSNRTDEEPASVYIWGDGEHNDAGLKIYDWSDFDYAYKLDRHGDKETIFGDKVSRTVRWNEKSTDIFESDVPRETRVLTDLYLDTDDVAKGHRVLFFDIEVEKVKGGFPSVDKADGVINAIGCYAGARDEYVVFFLNRDGVIKPTQVGNESIITFDNEEDLLNAFMAYYTEYCPTILTGWNIDDFDVPYLYRRLSVIFDSDTANMLSPIGQIKYSKFRRQYQIAGVSCLDYFKMYQKFTYARQPSYRLDAIGQFEVNMGKVEYEGSLDDFARNDPAGFIEYNLQDVRIVVALDKKMKLIDLVKNISHVGHTQYEDYGYSSKYIEGTIITYLHRVNKVVPNKRVEGRAEMEQRMEDNEEGFAGAFVKEPVPGLYEWVYNLDLQSLYPSIIMSLNISPETKIGYIKDWNLEAHIRNEITDYIVAINEQESPELSRDMLLEWMEIEGLTVSSNGILYRTDKVGVIPEILSVWFDQRLKFKGLMKKAKTDGNDELADYYDRRQHVQKILLNSIYGVLGLPIFRFYDLDNALAVTATGQDVIKTTAKFVNGKYEKTTGESKDHCIYIDTDSVYFSAVPFFVDGDDVFAKTIKIAESMESSLNKFYDTMAARLFFCKKHRFVIKGEAVSKTAFWVAKKRYAMLKVYDLDGKYELSKPQLAVKGLDTRRSSFPPAFKRIMSECLMKILQNGTKEELDKMILNFRDHLEELSFKEVARNTSVSDMSNDSKKDTGYTVFPKGTPAHVKAAISYNRWLREHNLDKVHATIKSGDKIKYVTLKKNPKGMPTMALKGYDDPEELVKYVNKYMDYDALFENDLKNKLLDFYTALNFGMLPTDVNQSASKFFDFS